MSIATLALPLLGTAATTGTIASTTAGVTAAMSAAAPTVASTVAPTLSTTAATGAATAGNAANVAQQATTVGKTIGGVKNATDIAQTLSNGTQQATNVASNSDNFFSNIKDKLGQSNQFTTVDPLYPDAISDTHPSAQRFYALNKDTHFNYIRNNPINPSAEEGSLFGKFLSKITPDKLEKWYDKNKDKIKDAITNGLTKTIGGQVEKRFNSLFDHQPAEQARSKSYEEGGQGQVYGQANKGFNMYNNFYSQVGGIKK